MDWVVAAITAIRAIRTEVNVPAGARACRCSSRMPTPAVSARLERHREHIQRLARVERIETVETVPAGGVAAVVEGTTLILRVGDVIDLAQGEGAARRRRSAGSTPISKKFAQKLGNPAFLAKAKPEVVEEQREREADARRDRDRLQAVYDRIAAG